MLGEFPNHIRNEDVIFGNSSASHQGTPQKAESLFICEKLAYCHEHQEIVKDVLAQPLIQFGLIKTRIQEHIKSKHLAAKSKKLVSLCDVLYAICLEKLTLLCLADIQHGMS